MFKRALAFILLGVVLAGAGAAAMGNFVPGGGHHSERGHDGDDD